MTGVLNVVDGKIGAICNEQKLFSYRTEQEMLVTPSAGRIILATNPFFEKAAFGGKWQQLISDASINSSHPLLSLYLNKEGSDLDFQGHVVSVLQECQANFKKIPLPELFFWVLLQGRVSELDLADIPSMTTERITTLIKFFPLLQKVTLTKDLKNQVCAGRLTIDFK